MTLFNSKRVTAALDALRAHEQREIELQRRYADAVTAADALASDLGAVVLEDPAREAKAAAELQKSRAAAEVLGAGVARAEVERARLRSAVALAHAADCRERAASLRSKDESLTGEVSRLFDEVERIEGQRPADLLRGCNSDRLWDEIQSLEDTARTLEADPQSGFSAVLATLEVERQGAAVEHA